MAQNKVMQLWTTIVTAFLALCTALGLVTTTTATTAAAAPGNESPRTGTPERTAPAVPTIPAQSRWAWSHARALPPTMKQRIRAEAHGKSPSCRHRPLDTTEAESTAPDHASAALLDC
ncbi:DUF6344 domain-containing protein [Streptomyces sp. FXJ1.172]|uniref:DUF6344 domain-containing protein n=1 Tax=Streptomyces sp. FXJ1.172 TaxID=710705 RepID=UPI0007D03E95|nr:DUF6344 domain-containing protein [Streptomyces sp. FXJ1.172]WEO96413.1 DUF6344 domain-containing protein [Streptomyces sp. FXJ1.172]